MEALAFSVYGTPRPQPRPRFVNGRVISTADPKAKLWRSEVDRIVRECIAHRGDALPLFNGAVLVRMIFTFVPVATRMRIVGQPHTFKPDADNLAKGVLDVMERAGVFGNDSQVAQMPSEKWWGDRAGVAVLVEPIEAGARSAVPVPQAAPDWLSSANAVAEPRP